MHEAALTLGMGERLALIPQLEDPKNLFGTLLKSTPSARLAASERLCAT
jgi:ornithine cyclodeaminase